VKDPFLKRLASGPVLADGAMGTQLYARGISFSRCFDELNISNPEIISEIHRDYIASGSELIETNSFGGNYLRLAAHGFERHVRAINLKAAKIARDAREISGRSVFVAGSIGPLGKALEPFGKIPLKQAEKYYGEQIEALLEGGVDLFIAETISDLSEMRIIVEVIKSICKLPVIASMTFNEDGVTFMGHTPVEVVKLLEELEVDVIGANCSVGPQKLLDVVHEFRKYTSKPISVMPNAGLPRYIDGRFIYVSSEEYFGEYARRFLDAGVNILGGCCGTTPGHIEKMAEVLKDYVRSEPQKDFIRVEEIEKEQKPVGDDYQPPVSDFEKKLRSGFVISVELDPPRGTNPEKVIKGAKKLKAAGVEAVNIADSPMARVRMSCMAMAYLIKQRVGLDVILHFTARDRNLMGLQSDLIGAHAIGIHNILAITGDPPSAGDYPNVTAVYDVDSIGLVKVIKKLNRGTDLAGNSIGKPTEFSIGVGVSPAGDNFDYEIERLAKKVEAGARYVFTQPIYDLKAAEKIARATEQFKIPVLCGILPLHSYRHAEFLHNEVPGIFVPDNIRLKLKQAGEQAATAGIQLSRELLDNVSGMFAGAYLMPSFGRYETVIAVLEGTIKPKISDLNYE
jgi:methionine synthase I (cobalamin-dependent)/5,10-methylenetetrahydrofolate reductase